MQGTTIQNTTIQERSRKADKKEDPYEGKWCHPKSAGVASALLTMGALGTTAASLTNNAVYSGDVGGPNISGITVATAAWIAFCTAPQLVGKCVQAIAEKCYGNLSQPSGNTSNNESTSKDVTTV